MLIKSNSIKAPRINHVVHLNRFDSLFNVIFIFTTLLIFASCQSESTKPNSTKTTVNLKDGFYLLNGLDEQYQVVRKNTNELYQLNPKAFLTSPDYSTVMTKEESNGMYSLDINLKPLSQVKWENAVADPKIHYIGFVHQKELVTVIKAKGHTNKNIFLKCISTDLDDITQIKERMTAF